MFLPRIIPVLLLSGKGLVKTTRFKSPKYIGDPINAVKIFNDLKADELVFLDINASKEGRYISKEIVKNIGDEAFMPFGVGGGISEIRQVEELLKAGAEKVIINTQAFHNPNLVKDAASNFGSQSVVVSVDVKRSLFGKQTVFVKCGCVNTGMNVIEYAKRIEELGAGELILNSIDNDGMMQGYDIDLIKKVSSSVNIPVVACGGAGTYEDLRKAYNEGEAHALSAGSMFVYHGPRKAVLINYPSKVEIREVFGYAS